MPARLRKRAQKRTKPSSTSWFDLPAEMREMVIDRMGPKTRCKFAKCSRMCEKEAKASKKYLISINIGRRTNAEILIGHTSYYNYCLEFINVADLSEAQSIVVYKTEPKFYSSCVSRMSPRVLKWMKIEKGNAEDVRLKYLRGFLEKYEKSIIYFQIDDTNFPFEKLNIKHLKNLKNIGGKLSADIVVKGFVELNQLMRTASVDLEETKLTFDQILQFEGYELTIESNEFNEENVLKYLNMWKNGEVSRNLENLEVFHTGGSRKLKYRNIIQGLDVYGSEDVDNDSGTFFFRLNYETKEKCYSRVAYWNECINVRIEKESSSEDETDESEFEYDLDSDV